MTYEVVGKWENGSSKNNPRGLELTFTGILHSYCGKDKSPHENYYDDGKYISTAKELNINLENSDLDSNQKEKFLAFLGKNRNVLFLA
jgi:hypothetical protein